MNKTKILRIIKFGIYLLLGFIMPYLILVPFYVITTIETFYLAAIYLTIGCFLHFGVRKLARKIGLINKEKIAWLETFLSIFAFAYWLSGSFLILMKNYSMNT